MRRALPVVVTAGLTAFAGLIAAGILGMPAHAAGSRLTAEVTQSSVWDSGYSAEVAIANSGDTRADGWTVEFDLPSGTTVSNHWSATKDQQGQHYTFTNVSYNADIAPGQEETFGFNASGLGLPLNCTVNGLPCDGGDETPTDPPTDPPTGPVVEVSTSAQLADALERAEPGQTISMAPGEYRGAFATQRAGTASEPITLTGPRGAVLVNDGPSGEAPSCPEPTSGWDPGYGLWLYSAPHWNLNGFTVKDSKKGVVLDDSHHVSVDGLYVHHVEEEGVHFRRSSADGEIRDSVIEHTGLVKPQYGEGVYLGSANSNWDCHGNSGGVDRSDRVLVENNRIGPYVTAEPIDIKEGTYDGVIRGNTFDGRGISGQNSADSWVDVKGVDYLIEDNTGTFSPPGVFANGYETHNPGTSPSFPNGCGTVWRNNDSDLGDVGQYAIKITSTSKCGDRPNVVYSSNTVTGATRGLTNIKVTP